MRAGLILGSASRRAGGVFEAVTQLAASLGRRPGVEVDILGCRDADTESAIAAHPTLSFRTYARVGPAALGFAPALRAALRSLRPDLVHAHGLWMHQSLATMRWSNAASVPRMVSPHGMLDPWALRISSVRKLIAGLLYERSNLRTARVVHALTESEAASIRAYGIASPMCVIPNGIELDAGPDVGAPSWHAEGVCYLLFLGRLHPKKGLLNLLRAWSAARPELLRSPWRLVIAGWDQDDHRAALARLADDLGVSDEIVFVGPVHGPEKHSTLRYADAFILPSMSEGLPMAVLEAWASSLPVVLTPQCNLPEGVSAGAAIESEADPDRLAEALRCIAALSDRERQTMGERGRRLVEERFGWETIARRMLRVYEWAIGGGEPPPDIRMD